MRTINFVRDRCAPSHLSLLTALTDPRSPPEALAALTAHLAALGAPHVLPYSALADARALRATMRAWDAFQVPSPSLFLDAGG